MVGAVEPGGHRPASRVFCQVGYVCVMLSRRRLLRESGCCWLVMVRVKGEKAGKSSCFAYFGTQQSMYAGIFMAPSAEVLAVFSLE